MADNEKVVRKLPPLSPRPQSETAVKKKKKKRPADESPRDATPEKPIRQRRKKLPTESVSQDDEHDESKTESGLDNTVTEKVAKRRKKKAPTTETGIVDDSVEESVVTNDSAVKPTKKRKIKSPPSKKVSEDTNDKDDLDNELDSEPIIEKSKPRKKKQAKQKNVKSDDDYTDSHSGLAAELTNIEDDILDVEEGEQQPEASIQPTTVAATILKSVPTSKLFIETERGFKGEKKSRVTKHVVEGKSEEILEQESPKYTTLDFALGAHHVMQTGALFLHGLTAGVALWHIVIVYILSANPHSHILLLYQPMAQPVHCMFYILFGLCTVSAMDRSDVGHMTWRFFIRAITLQSGAPAVVLYLVALVLSLSIVGLEDQIHLWRDYTDLWFINATTMTFTSDFAYSIQLWKNINTARGVAAILGWLVLSVVPKYDRLSQNLRAEHNLIHGIDVQS